MTTIEFSNFDLPEQEPQDIQPKTWHYVLVITVLVVFAICCFGSGFFGGIILQLMRTDLTGAN